jgi:membrane-associated phospholipid phosphatase
VWQRYKKKRKENSENEKICNFATMKLKFLLLLVLFSLKLRAQVADDALQYVPFAAAVGLDFCGVEARHLLRERIALTATSFASLTVTAGTLKLTVSERRPDGSNCHSFPSGHAARAFAGAELMRSEYGWAWGTAAYALATTVGVLRVTGDHHYTHDVVAGAVIGIASTRLAYWLLPLEKKLFGWDNENMTVSALPAYNHDTRSFGVALTATLY